MKKRPQPELRESYMQFLIQVKHDREDAWETESEADTLEDASEYAESIADDAAFVRVRDKSRGKTMIGYANGRQIRSL